MGGLEGRRILIAGGTGNVGRYLVREHLALGATVVVPSRSRTRLDALHQSLNPDVRPRLVPVVGDIASDGSGVAVGPLDGAAASLGGFVAAPQVLSATSADLQRALDGYVHAHFAVARAVIPLLATTGGGYVTINGPLAFEPMFSGAGLVSVATAAQGMLARVLMREYADSPVRVNEVVIYSNIGRGADDENEVTGGDIGRAVAWLLSADGAAVRGRTLHLRTRDALPGPALAGPAAD